MLQIYESKIDKIIQNGVKSTKRALKPYFWQSSKTIPLMTSHAFLFGMKLL